MMMIAHRRVLCTAWRFLFRLGKDRRSGPGAVVFMVVSPWGKTVSSFGPVWVALNHGSHSFGREARFQRVGISREDVPASYVEMPGYLS